ncbi:MAG: hypothetical protein R3B45_06920 [Bdellovibrionota bacterium]
MLASTSGLARKSLAFGYIISYSDSFLDPINNPVLARNSLRYKKASLWLDLLLQDYNKPLRNSKKPPQHLAQLLFILTQNNNPMLWQT